MSFDCIFSLTNKIKHLKKRCLLAAWVNEWLFRDNNRVLIVLLHFPWYKWVALKSHIAQVPVSSYLMASFLWKSPIRIKRITRIEGHSIFKIYAKTNKQTNKNIDTQTELPAVMLPLHSLLGPWSTFRSTTLVFVLPWWPIALDAPFWPVLAPIFCILTYTALFQMGTICFTIHYYVYIYIYSYHIAHLHVLACFMLTICISSWRH